MIVLLHGDDEYRISERINALNETIDSPELRQLNITNMDAQACSVDEVLSAIFAIPFMSDKRIVYIENLSRTFSQFDKSDNAINKVQGSFQELLTTIPDSTTLVILERDLGPKDKLMKIIHQAGRVEYYPHLKGRQIIDWISERSKKIGLVIQADAIQLLADSMGNNLRMIESEMTKLGLYKDQEVVTRDDVSMMVPFVREQSVFKVVDSAILGNKGNSIRHAKILVASGTSPIVLFRLIERQVRLMLLAKSLNESGYKEGEISRRLSLFGYPMQKTMKMATTIKWDRLLDFHDFALACDLKIKDGVLSEEEALDWLIIEMSS